MKRVNNLAFRWVLSASLIFGLMSVLSSSVSAGLVEYCDVTGDNVVFSGLVETTTGSVEMYGQPFADGDTLVSNGLGFLTQSVGGGVELVDGRLQMTIMANEGFLFNELNVSALGSYFGLGNDALSIVNSSATVESDGLFYSDGMIVNNNGTSQAAWQGDYTISFPDTDEVTLTLNLQLLAASGPADAAFIEASSVRVSVNSFAASVPEPSTFWWLAIGMLAVSRRRHRSVV